MQRLGVSGAVRLIYRSLGVKRLRLARTPVVAWKPPTNILETSQEYPSHDSRTAASPASLLGAHSATCMAAGTIEIHSTKTSPLEFSVT